MSITDAFTGQQAEEERKRKLERLAESAAQIAAMHGLTVDEFTDALKVAMTKKRLNRTDKSVSEMSGSKVLRMSTYVVTAYRWGQRNAHSFVVAALQDLEAAKAVAHAYSDYRGGKYACEVVEAAGWSEDTDTFAKQVYYVESPYYGSCGDAGHFHPADNKKPSFGAPAPVTLRAAHNKIFWLKNALQMLDERVHRNYDFNADPDGMTLRVSNALGDIEP